jgi:hypothetical protein
MQGNYVLTRMMSLIQIEIGKCCLSGGRTSNRIRMSTEMIEVFIGQDKIHISVFKGDSLADIKK